MLTRISHRKLWTSARRVLLPVLCSAALTSLTLTPSLLLPLLFVLQLMLILISIFCIGRGTAFLLNLH
ncbi:hypothetical protein S83_036726 [Arachis hypogaea]